MSKTALTKTKYLTSLIVVVLSLIAYHLSPITTANAQSTQVFTAIPPRLEINAKPGEFIHKTLQFRNEGDTVAYLSAIPKDFIVKNASGQPEFVTSLVSGRWAASSWMHTNPSSFAVAPKSIATITLSINVPPDALPGGHYAGVLYEAKGSTVKIGQGTGASSAIQQVVGTLVYLSVEGPIKEQAVARLFEAPRFSEFGPINFTTEIFNNSDIHIAPKGKIVIRDMLGQVMITLPLEERNIFPGSDFLYKNTWEVKYLLGRFRADLEAPYGTTGQVLVATLYFFVFPVRMALAILLAILIMVLIMLYVRRRKQKQEEAAELAEAEQELKRDPEK